MRSWSGPSDVVREVETVCGPNAWHGESCLLVLAGPGVVPVDFGLGVVTVVLWRVPQMVPWSLASMCMFLFCSHTLFSVNG